MMKRHILISFLVCSAIIFGAMQVYGEDMGPGRWWRQPQLAGDLKLTDREKQSLDELFNKNRNQLIDMKGGLEKERYRLEDILNKNPVDEAAAKAQFKKVQDLRQKLASSRFQYLLGVRKILGPDRFQQLTGKFQEMRQQRYGGSRGYMDSDPSGSDMSGKPVGKPRFEGWKTGTGGRK